ncbi:M24 family metallopeptidase [Celerinatantimonas sp. MCCC 1A17872]|uniref:M24 family metallopeptidase n=1 Tax=Celerinatantimonas sp. MCCC 1A17872 TaxID=3177514 RepID=UPI0038C2C0FB
MQIQANTFELTNIPEPHIYEQLPCPQLSQETIDERLRKILTLMHSHHLDKLVIYADKEHGSNFEYLSGFIPRFEEALLVISDDGTATYIMGNENLKLVPHARLKGQCLHAPVFSLPNQPMAHDAPLTDVFKAAGIESHHNVGMVGWKLFSTETVAQDGQFDVPYFIVFALKSLIASSQLHNATALFIAPGIGSRTTNNANEIAHYEYGANLASTQVLKAMNAIELGKTEKMVASVLSADGQPNSVVQIAATGERFNDAQLYPRDKAIQLGDKFSLTTGYKGGLTSRAAYVVHNASELAPNIQDYCEVVVKPYYNAVIHWLENLQLGITGKELYLLIDAVLPRQKYHWHLNPGHFVADEEWLSSAISADSEVKLTSGMLLQIDIIPSVAGYAGASIEDTVALADEQLRQALRQAYPELWARISARRDYLCDILHIHLPECVLPLSNTVGYLRPYLLNKQMALTLSNRPVQ